LETALDNADAYLILNLLPGIGPLRVTQLLTLFGAPGAVLQAKAGELARVPGIGSRLAGTISNWRDHCDPQRERELAREGGVEVLTRDDDAYPSLLREIHDPPLCLYVRGDVGALRDLRSAIAVVGSRRTTSYGVRMAENLAAAAGMAGWAVVSGLARGIDTAAHEAALRIGGRTIAVLGSGLAQVYPQENIDLARRIAAADGAVVSELPMLYRPDKRTFPMRNRIISGMTRGCVVVEAGSRSGALITASQALDQNRLVFAVPGRVDSPQSKGCHALIKEGAKLVESFQDVLEEFVTFPGLLESRGAPSPCGDERRKTREIATADLQLSDLERKLLTFLDDGEVAIDELVVQMREPPARILGALVTLEMRHLVRQLPGKRVVKNADVVTG